MRVTFCAYDRPGYVGGPNAGLIRLLPELKARSVKVLCLFLTFAPHGQCPTIRALEAAGIPCRSALYHPTTELRVRWLLLQIRENPPDIFVPNLMPAAYFAARWCRKAGITTIGIIRNVDVFHEGFLEEFAFGLEAFRQTAFVGVSAQAVEMIRKLPVPLAAAEQIPSPVFLPGETISYADGTFRVLSSGRMVERQKQVCRTVRAFCRAAELVPDTGFTLIGDGPDAEKVQAELDRCRQGLPVRIAGRINPLDMPDELKRHHCIALLSDYEGMPLALMEAMAHGLVPISLKHCIGAAELIQDGINGLLIDDAEKNLPQAVSLLKNDPELFKRLSMAARERIRTVSELGIVTEKWLSLFNSIKGAEGPRRPVRNPVRLNLPPCNPKVACEDDRASFLGRLNGFVKSRLPFFVHGENTQFISPRCLPSTVDTYTVRTGILRALEKALPLFSGMVADVGAGTAPYKPLVLEAAGVTGYLSLDLAGSAYARPDIFWDGKRLPLADGSVETVMATEVLEHCPAPEALLSEMQRVLAPGGFFFGTVPFLWPVHDVPHDHWRYTPWALTRLLEKTGFSDIHITATGGYEAAMAQMLGLWVRRRSRSKFYQYFIRPILSALSVPLVWGLMRMDKGADEFREGLMVTGLSITAKKEKLV